MFLRDTFYFITVGILFQDLTDLALETLIEL